MSFKDGIPLLATLDDEDDEASDVDITIEDRPSGTSKKWTRKQLLFSMVLAVAVFGVVIVIIGVTLTVLLLHNSHVGSPVTPPPSHINEYRAPLDSRLYKVLTLDNSLRVLLISDPNSNMSAASMEVAAGSFSDPPEAEGLAHFCEHMLFLGTKKYPNEHSYSSFLSSHGGYDNAFTSTQETNYYFRIDAAYLEQALDMFAQFFIAPLFKESSVEDEVHAVNAEHEKNLLSDGWKVWQLLKHISNPTHPFHKFSTGTLSTLNSSRIPLLTYLKEYYNTNYSANTLQLAVYGRDSIDTLTDWVQTYFSDIPNHSISPQTFSTTAFPQEYSGKLVIYRPVADSNTLSIYWQTLPLESLYRNDVTEFLSRYLGYEGPGSILYYLKNKNWMSSLSAGLEVDADSFSLLVVSGQVTEEGLKHVYEIVDSIFQYIRLLSNQSDSGLQSMWDDYIAVSQVTYNYSEPQEPSDYVTNLAQAMRLVVDPEDFLGNPSRRVLNISLVHTVLSSLSSPDNSLVFIGTQNNLSVLSDQFDIELSLDKTEPIYSTPFAIHDIPSRVVDHWSSSEGSTTELYLPGDNTFIPTNFDILPPPSTTNTSPVRIHINNGTSLWWQQDTTFRTPHVNMYCSIDSIHPNTTSVVWSELTTLYSLLATEFLTPILYPATELTYSASLSSTPTGLQLSFSGFSDPNILETYIKTTVTNMKNFSGIEKVFNRTLEDRRNFLENYGYTTLPFRYIYRYLQQVVMDRPYWKHEEELSATETITAGDVIDYARMLFNNATFLCFAHGNIDKQQAIRYTELVVNTLSPTPSTNSTPEGGYQRKRVRLSQPGNYSVTLPTLNPTDQNSAVNVVYQIGSTCDKTGTSSCSDESIMTAAHLGLLAQIIGDQCFYQLRTVEQLGYVAFCFQGSYAGIGSYQVVVQSQEYNASYVLREIDRFLNVFYDSTVAIMTKNQLDEQKALYANTLEQQSQTLSEESDRLWTEVVTGREQFDYNNQLLMALNDIDVHSMRSFYTQYITDYNQYRKLVLGVYGEDKEVDFSQEFSHCIDYDTLDHSSLQYPTSSMTCNMS